MKKLFFLYLFFSIILNAGMIFAKTANNKSSPDLDPAGNKNETAQYFNIGGHLFAGDYPINNPVSTGDTGIVYLYRVFNNTIIPIDTNRVMTFGYFIFSQILQGEYILKAGLTPKSTRYKEYFPVYYTSSLKWTTSDHLELNDTNRYEVNIHLLPTTESLTGPGSMTGFVMQTMKDPGFQKLINAEIVLFNANMLPLIYSFSDNYGNFSFQALPYGIYYLMVESTGKFPALLRITLDENHPVIDSLILEVFGHAPMNVLELNGYNRISSLPVFPNPATENINLVLRSSEPENLIIEITSLTGQKIYSSQCQVNGFKSLSISLNRFSKGVYHLILRSEDGQWSQIQKFLKF